MDRLCNITLYSSEGKTLIEFRNVKFTRIDTNIYDIYHEDGNKPFQRIDKGNNTLISIYYTDLN